MSCCCFFKALRGNQPTGKVINILITGWHHRILVCYKENISFIRLSSGYLRTGSQMPSLSPSFTISQIVLGRALQQIFPRPQDDMNGRRGNLINITMEEVQQRKEKKRHVGRGFFRKRKDLLAWYLTT